MKAQYKDFAKKILYYGGYYSLQERLHAPSEHRLLIIMYHNIVTDQDQRSHWFLKGTPSESQFEAVLTTLKKHYRVISVEDAVQEIREVGKLKERSAAITFDDGYRSTYSIVFPLLQRLGVTATVYPYIDWIDGQITPWWFILAGMINQCELTLKEIGKIETVLGNSVGLDANSLKVPADARWALLGSIKTIMMRMNDEIRNQIIGELHGFLPDGRDDLFGLYDSMTWEHVKEMSAHGIRFGAHTCSHTNLSHVTLETAEREIIESKHIIENHLGVKVTGFAYPYGYDVAGYQRFKPMLEKNGFRYACTSWPGYVDTASDSYLLDRIGLPNTSSSAILARTLSLDYCFKPEHSNVPSDT